MRDVMADIDQWIGEGEPVALATVIETWGSSPRPVGAKLALTADARLSGSVSGGCVEGAVVEAGQEVLETGQPQILQFGVADETAWEVGLACGGNIELLLAPLTPAIYQFLHTLIDEERSGWWLTIVDGPDERLGEAMAVDAQGNQIGDLGEDTETAVSLAQEVTQSHQLPLGEELTLFVDVIRPAPLLVMVGGVHIAIALTAIAKTLNYRTLVIDPRRAFGSQARFPHVDELIQAWPEKAFAEAPLTPETAVTLLSHDPKIDDPALKALLESDVGYIGALGSSRTHTKRVARLKEMGFGEEEIGRIHAPVGLDIGARTPAEIALAIMAEVVRVRRGT